MVTVNFKLTDMPPVQLTLDREERFERILEHCAAKTRVEIGGVIAIRKNRVITGSDLVRDHDEIDVFPALSGG